MAEEPKQVTEDNNSAKSEKKKSWFARHKILTVVIAVVLLIIIAGALGGDKTKTTTTTTKTVTSNDSTKKESKTETVAKKGEAVRDGKFEFTVNSVTCGKSSVGDQYLNKNAQGQYCLVNVTVKNIGTEAQTFDSSNQFAFDAQGAKFSSDSAASFYANPQGSTFLNEINPGNSVTGDLVFDMPKDKQPVTVVLHDSAFSSGVKVNVQ